jgi:PAS domain S-box-containing protein
LRVREAIAGIRRRYPPALLGYLLATLGTFTLTVPIHFVYQHPAPRNPILSAVLTTTLLLLLLVSGWLGYGAGLLACFLTCFVVPWFVPQANRGLSTSLLQFVVLSFMTLLVSRVADVGRRHRAALQRAAEELDRRVQERTAAAMDSANKAEERAQLLELAHDAILSLDWDGSIRYWNRGAERLYGWSKEQALGKTSHTLLKTVFPEPYEQIERKLQETGHWEGELEHTRRDGSVVPVESRWALRRDGEGLPAGFLEINTDITERRRVEEQLRHTAKLESLGVLAGGVAHDFNNLLTGILGNASLALDGTPAHHPQYGFLEDVVRAAERAADLTRQLLAYSGKGRFVLRTLNLSEVVRDISELVQVSIPKGVQLRLQLADDLPRIDADPGQMQQIVMNLILNGAEAIGPDGGTVLVRTGAQEVDPQYIGTFSQDVDRLTPGRYVMLEVHDTGCGMSADTLARIFDPFFTTKFTGRGLGLSAVQGIVRGHRGALKVYTEVGQGTTFKVLFPMSAAVVSDAPARLEKDLTGTGTILIVDDEEIVRQAARHTLESYGYQTLTASDGAEAVRIFRAKGNMMAAVLLDLTMPVMNGEEAIDEILASHPGIRVIVSTGYDHREAVARFSRKRVAGYLQKPYTSRQLAEKVQSVLGNGGAAAGR